jgi:predicted nucleotidyltransferase
MDKHHIIKSIQSNAEDLQKLGAERLGLFGSFVRGEQNDESDIDILVEFKPGLKTYRNYLNLADYLEAKLGRKVDLLTWEGMASFVKREVLKKIEFISFNE